MECKLLEIEGIDSSRTWLEIQKREVSLSTEKVELYCFRDFSTIVNANEALRNKELTTAMSSHELKTPLQGIIGMLGLLEKEHKDSVEIKLAYRSSMLMLSLIEDMLDFGSILNGSFTKRMSAFSVR